MCNKRMQVIFFRPRARQVFFSHSILLSLVSLSFAADLSPYPHYEYSHVILDVIHSPLAERKGVGRLFDEFPVAYGREWFPEGPYIDVERVDHHVDNPLGRYYLYFTAHAHVGCGLAYADNLNGPWTFLDTLLWMDGAAVDVHWLDESKQFAAYYHPSNSHSDMRFSTDGIHWSENQLIATGADVYGGGSFFYTKVFEHTCPTLDNKYIMLWRAQSPKDYENGRWRDATCMMYSNDGIEWTLFPDPIHYDYFPLGSNFLQWGENRFLLMNWGYGYCSRQLVPGGPNVMIYETDSDLALHRGSYDGTTCHNTMELLEAEPGCGYTIDADSGRGPLEGKHIVEGDTLYHFCVAWNDSAPTEKLNWGKNWENGQIALWKAYIPDDAMPGRTVGTTPEPSSRRPAPTSPGTAPALRLNIGLPPVTETGRKETVFTLRGRSLGEMLSGRDTDVARRRLARRVGRGVVVTRSTGP